MHSQYSYKKNLQSTHLNRNNNKTRYRITVNKTKNVTRARETCKSHFNNSRKDAIDHQRRLRLIQHPSPLKKNNNNKTPVCGGGGASHTQTLHWGGGGINTATVKASTFLLINIFTFDIGLRALNFVWISKFEFELSFHF